jgi:hypothetical protein
VQHEPARDEGMVMACVPLEIERRFAGEEIARLDAK